MKARLQIQNFGPIDILDIEISKFNILIGPQASGKSTIAKVLSIIHSFDYKIFPINKSGNKHSSTISENEKFDVLIPLLTYYRIENFRKKNTYWFFEDESFSFKLNGIFIEVEYKKNLENTINQTESYYFPAERIALPMISESLFELTLSQSTLPGYFLQFGKDFTIARKNQKTFNISTLKVEFEYNDGRNIVILGNNHSLFLEETSSAIQANLPLLVILQYPVKEASLFVVEELELHGFPALQKDMLYYIIERMKHPKLNQAYVMLPTHSPYILSAANNLLFAAKVAKQDSGSAAEVDKIIRKESWIDREDFSAYYIINGTAKSIVSDKTGLIDENELDGISESLAGEFDALMDLYKPVTA
jgi:predicted ATP-dependent endonuclease of OLD family